MICDVGLQIQLQKFGRRKCEVLFGSNPKKGSDVCFECMGMTSVPFTIRSVCLVSHCMFSF